MEYRSTSPVISILLIISLTLGTSLVSAQNVGINNTGAAPNANAMLDISSSTMGLLIPRMTTTERTTFGGGLAATDEGMTVYDTDTDSYWLWDGAAWVEFDMDPTNEYNTSFSLTSNTLSLTDGGGTLNVDLSVFDDSTDADTDSTNEYNTNLNLNGNILELTDGGGTLTQDLSSLSGNDGDWDRDAGNGYMYPTNIGDQIGIGTTTPTTVTNTQVELNNTGFASMAFVSDAVEGIFTASGSNSRLSIGSFSDHNVTMWAGDVMSMKLHSQSNGEHIEINPSSSWGVVDLNIIGENDPDLFWSDVVNDNIGIGTSTPSSKLHVFHTDGTSDINDHSGYTGAMSGSTSGGAAHFATTSSTDRIAIYGETVGTADYVAMNGFSSVWMGMRGETTLQQSNVSATVGSADMAGGSFDATGVYGVTQAAAGWGLGVVGEGNFYGVFANGDLGASGTKAFVIDHPGDPENKVLRHFAIESNKVQNQYNGTTDLDQNGEATIQLPEYFQQVNRNPSYQLTPIGGPMPNLHIKEAIGDGRIFKVAGGEPGKQVSWEVTAERNDPYLRQNPQKREVVREKKDYQKGKYFMPELYDQPEEKSMYHDMSKPRNPKMEKTSGTKDSSKPEEEQDQREPAPSPNKESNK